MSTRWRHALHVAVVIAVVALVIAFARGVDWRAVGTVARGADTLLLAAALVCNLVSLALKGVRWWVFLRPLGVRSLSLVLRATFAGASLNNLLVAQGGEGVRVVIAISCCWVARRGSSHFRSISRAGEAPAVSSCWSRLRR
jgi:uncharacterized membrane protein YbhN (UPF0104 family)